MRRNLILHPVSRCTSVASIVIDLTRRGSQLQFCYTVAGNIDQIRIPDPMGPVRADKLWEHTVFECFIRTGRETYVEFNFSPSGQWAAYRFARYRGGVANIPEVPEPVVTTRRSPGNFQLLAGLDLGALPDLPGDQSWTFAVTSVIEEIDGNLSYWSLAHGAGKPDFHHLDGFVLEIAAEQA